LAQPQSGLTQLAVRDPKAQPGGAPAQRLRLRLTNPDDRGITSVQLTVHGLTAKGQVEPVISNTPKSATALRLLNLELAIDSGKSADRDVSFTGFTSVRSIDIEAVTYADGSQWKATASAPCTVVPDRFMAVAAN